MPKLSLYVHIPFCIQKCNYCDFLSAKSTLSQRKAYSAALCREVEAEAKQYMDYEVETVFLGGGTPSVMETNELEALFELIRKKYRLTEQAEITIEVTPGTVDLQKLLRYRKMGINRLSIGLQSMKEKELELLGRIHTPNDFMQAFSMARTAGFNNINIDLMAALPGQTKGDFLESLDEVINLEPEHISAYSLILEEGTPFYEWEKQGKLLPVLEEEEERSLDHTIEETLKRAGYERYEISNYARAGRECRHNKVYWTRGNYAGFGVGAASMVENIRWSNTADFEKYLAAAGREDIRKASVISQKEQIEEFMFLGLRLSEGVSVKVFEETFGCSLDSVYGVLLRKLEEQGLVLYGDNVMLTTYGRDISNFVMSQFLFI